MVPTPPEAVSSAAGGPAVAVVDVMKSKVVAFEGGGPCGSPYSGSSDSNPPDSPSQRRADETSTRDYALMIAPPVAGVAIVVAGVWLWRRYG